MKSGWTRGVGRRRLWALAGTVTIVIPLLAGWFPQDPLRRRAEIALRRAFPEARIGRLHVVPGLLAVEVDELHLPGDGFTLDVAEIRGGFSPPPLSGGAPALRYLHVSAPRLSVVAAGAPSGEPAPTLPFPLRISELSVRDGHLQHESPEGMLLALEGLSASGSLGTGALTLRAERLDVGGAPRAGPIEARLTVTPALGVHLDRFEGQLGDGSRITAAGAIGDAFAPAPVLKGSLSLDLADASPFGVAASGRAGGEFELDAGSEPWRGRIDVQGSGLRIAGWPLDTLSLAAAGTTDDAELTARSEALGGRAEARARLQEGRLEARADLAHLSTRLLAAGLGLAAPPIAGRLSGELVAQGPLDGELSVESQLSLADPSVETLIVSGRGSLRPDGPAVDVDWRATLAGGSALPGAPAWLRELQVRLDGTARGELPPELRAALAARLGADLPAGALDAEINGTVRNRGPTSEAHLEAALGAGSLEIDVSADGAELATLGLSARDLELADLVPGLQGRLRLQLAATGPESALAAEGTLGIEGLGVSGVELGRLDAGLRHARGASRLELEVPALGATARLQGSPPYPRIEGELDLDSLPLALLAPWAAPESDLSGLLSGSATFSVPADDPLAATALVDLRALELTAAGQGLRLAGPAELGLAERRVRARNLALEANGVALSLEGEAGTDPGEPLSADVELRAILGELPAPAGWKLAGSLTGSAHIGGTLRAPQPVGRLEIGPIEARLPGLPAMNSGPGRIAFDGDVAELDPLRVDVAGGSVTVSGRVSLASLWGRDRSGSSALTLRWTDLDVAQLVPSPAPGESAALDARLAGEATISGDLFDLAGLQVDVHGEAAELDVSGLGVSLSPYRLRLEDGRLIVDELAMTAREERFAITGQVGLVDRSLGLRARGTLALRTFNPFLPEAALSGNAEVDVRLEGTWDAPEARGQLVLSEGTLRFRLLDQPLTEIRGNVFLDGTMVRVEDVRGLLGGGEVRLDGVAVLEGVALDAAHLEAHGKSMSIQYPEGFKSRVDADLVLAGARDALELTGSVRIQRGLYDVDIALQESLFAEVVEPEESPLLRSIGLDVNVEVDNPILVRNNLARLEARGRLTARGNLDRPAPYGRLEIVPGGRVFLQTREFVVESGDLAYSGDFDPQVSVTAGTRIEAFQELGGDATGDKVQFDVTIEARGSLESPRLSFTSTPPASEPELISIIATGRTRNQALGQGSRIAAGQMAAFLAGRVTSDLSRTLEQFGLDQVSIQPQLLAREQDPTARFTFGKRVTDYATLLYSVGLGGPEERFIRLEVSPLWDVSAAVQRDDSGLFTYGLGQKLRWGGPPRPRLRDQEERRVRLDAVRLEGELPLSEELLRAELRSESGKRTTSWDVQDDAERLRGHLADLGYIEAQVGARLEDRTAVFHLRSGPRYSWRVEGFPDAPDLDETVRQAFHEDEALQLGRDRLVRALRRRGHLRAAVATRGAPVDGGRVLVFEVEPGPTLEVARLEFPGASALSSSALERAAGGAAELLVAPDDAAERIRAAYREAYYYSARVSDPEVAEDGGSVSIRVPVEEGPRAVVARVEVRGAPPSDPPPGVALEEGARFSPDAATAAAARLREHYLARGYPGVDVAVRLVPEGSDVVVGLEVDARERVVIGAIELAGLQRTRESLVRKQLTFAVGDPLDPRQLVRSEARLLALGVFSRATITADDNPATVRVEIVEMPKFTAAYDLRYDEEERFVGLLESEAGNLLGTGLTVGARARAGADLRELRGSLFLPSLWAGGDLTISAFRREQDELAVAGQPDFGEREQLENGIQLQQNLRLGGRWHVLYGYGFTRTRNQTPFFPDPLITELASLDAGVFRDSRDNPLDPTRGRFYAVDLRLAQGFLGSDTHFVKGFAQAFFHRELSDSLLWAHGYRLGLAHGFDGRPIVGDERFEAGGANSVRGFETNSLGPRDTIFNEPLGGEAVLVLNQELRYRHPSGMGAVLFWDAGNVFAGVADLSFDLRHSLGVGIRYRSPVGLVRLDWAFPLARKEDESGSRLHFSIGQAF